MTPSERLAEMKLQLLPPPQPVGSYVPAIRVGDLVLVSGQIPLVEG